MSWMDKYPYTNFHELNLDWVLETVKKLAADWSTYHAQWDVWQSNTNAAFQSLHDYVMNYFRNLDVQDEIDSKLARMAASGELTALIEPLLPSLISTWLEEHITPTTPPLDKTLLVDSAAANSLSVGNHVFTLENQLYYDSKYCNKPFRVFFEPGNVTISPNGTWTYADTYPRYRLRTRENIVLKLHAGDVIHHIDTALTDYYIGFRNEDGTTGVADWRTGNYTVQKDGEFCILQRYLPSGGYDNIIPLAFNIEIIPQGMNIEPVNLAVWDDLEIGYLNSADGAENDVAGKVTHEMRSRFIPVTPGQVMTVLYRVTTPESAPTGYFMNVCYYKANKEFISGALHKDYSYTGAYSTKQRFIMPEGCAFFRMSARCYNDGLFAVYYGNPAVARLDDWYKIAVNHPHVTDRFNVKSIAHSGWAYGDDAAPEDTLPAYTMAKQNKFVMVETDVRNTEDGVPVLLHDVTIDRTSDGTGRVYDYTWAQLQQYDFGSYKGEQWAGTKIPSFEEFVKLCRDLHLYPYCELKYPMTKEVVKTCVDIVKKYGMEESVSFISMDYRILAHVRRYSKIARIGIVYNTEDVTDWAAEFHRLKFLRTSKNQVFIDARIILLNFSNPDSVQTGYQTLIDNNMPCEVWLVTSNPNNFRTTDGYVTGFTTSKFIYQDTINSDHNIPNNNIIEY